MIELIIIVVVIGLLAGLTIPKFIDVVRDAQMASLYQDMDTLAKAIDVYIAKEDNYPFTEQLDLKDNPILFSIVKNTGDTGTQLYKVDLQKNRKIP